MYNIKPEDLEIEIHDPEILEISLTPKSQEICDALNDVMLIKGFQDMESLVSWLNETSLEEVVPDASLHGEERTKDLIAQSICKTLTDTLSNAKVN